MLITYCCCIIVSSCTSCIAPCRSQLMFMHTVDHVQTEPGSEVQDEQVPEVFEGSQMTSCVDTNIAFKQGKSRCIQLIILGFSFNHYHYDMLECAITE
jgi:hypothetical protein